MEDYVEYKQIIKDRMNHIGNLIERGNSMFIADKHYIIWLIVELDFYGELSDIIEMIY